MRKTIRVCGDKLAGNITHQLAIDDRPYVDGVSDDTFEGAGFAFNARFGIVLYRSGD